MKKILLGIMLVLSISILCLTGCSTKSETALNSESSSNKESVSNQNVTKIHFDYPVYNDVDTLSNDAKIIVTGSIIKDSVTREININAGENRDKAPTNFIYTISELKVEKVLKGDVKVGDILEIKQAGGTDTNKTTLVEGAKYLRTDDRGLFFLSEKYVFDIPYDMINPDQGFVQFDDGKTKNTDKKVFTDNLKEEDIISKVKQSVESNAKK